ncbi:MarR family winged helix-turn-helix transcriptional regulator [Nocardia jinanensis]|uniref:HTH marR-type domain-containing protein n=1 Tax=Nocardia jinanensis TaxID=382504 RepID=A0A917RI32_9NOCA|nr:MarR family winged helix-turn-helix transcriptional regulator [Nocardia jinanensis]GGL07530.1 hypothetical protein GCM10011588_22500 [Nocardia jinanensis]
MDDTHDSLSAQIGGRRYLAHRSNRALRRYQLALRHLGVVSCLAAGGPLDQRALITRLQVDKSSMVYIVDELERQGPAERRRDERDRRSYAVRLTPCGLDRLAAEKATEQAMTELLAPLPPRDRGQLNELPTRFTDTPPTRNERGTPTGPRNRRERVNFATGHRPTVNISLIGSEHR